MKRQRARKTVKPAVRTPLRKGVRRTAAKVNDTATAELLSLAASSAAHKWLDDPAEDIYTLHDGKPAKWPSKRTNGAL